MITGQQVKIWDPLVRTFHWALVTAFTIAYFTDDEDLLLPHTWAGYVVIGLLVFRLLWGFVGTTHARFSDFIYAPSAAIAFVRDIFRGKSKRYLGHNPVGGWMIIIMLIMIALISITGLLLYGADEHAGPLAGLMAGAGKGLTATLEDSHEFLANFTVFLVAVHLVGVMVESILQKENLARAMVTGMKRREGNELELVAAKAGGKGAAIVSGLLAIVVAMFAAGMLGGSTLARADAQEVKDLQAAKNLLPLEDIIDKAKEQRPGQLIEAELKTLNGQEVYEIEILDEEGKVWEKFFDAKSGEPITHGEDKHSENPGR
jgi:cytochrome b